VWPDLDAEPAGLGPIALVQPARGAFVREGGQTRSRGTLAVCPDTGPDPVKEVAFIGVACRGRKETRALTLERTLMGQATYPFDPVSLDLSSAACGQFRDVIPAKTLGAGTYSYSARILAGGETLSERTLQFKVGTEMGGPTRHQQESFSEP